MIFSKRLHQVCTVMCHLMLYFVSFSVKLGVMIGIGMSLMMAPSLHWAQTADPAVPIQSPDLLKTIEIVGNSRVPSRDILNSISLLPGTRLNPLLIDRVKRTVSSMGYFSSVSTEVKKSESGQILMIFVAENPIISDVVIVGNTVYSTDDLLGRIQSKQGEPYNLNNLRRDIQAIQSRYKDNGYLLVTVIPTRTPDSEQTVLEYTLTEGIIDAIVISGNTKTKGYVVTREIESEKGRPANFDVIKEDLRRIYNLNFFTDVSHEFITVSPTNNHQILKINLVENDNNGQVSFGGSYGQQSGFSLFSDLYLNNLFGTAQTLMLRGQFGIGSGNQSARYDSYQLKYFNPWMWDKRKSFEFKVWQTRGQLSSINPLNFQRDFRQELRRGVESSIGLPITDTIKNFHSLKVESVSLLESGMGYRIHSYTYTLAYDSRDVWFNPTSGWYNTMSLEKAFALLETSFEYVRGSVAVRYFYPITPKQVIATRAEVSRFTSSTQGANIDDILAGEYYYVGGNATVRGYDDAFPFAFGNQRALGSLEYRFLFNRSFTGVVFIDSGYANIDQPLFNFRDYRVGKGIGIRINTPLGPLRFDYGFDDLGISRIHFNIGHQF